MPLTWVCGKLEFTGDDKVDGKVNVASVIESVYSNVSSYLAITHY